eukprot:14007054-Alexandrium_andersonii.AAC.2
MANVAASFIEADDDEYPLEGCFAAAVGLPEQNCYKKPESDEVLAMAEAECRSKGVGPHQPMHAGTHFRAQVFV